MPAATTPLGTRAEEGPEAPRGGLGRWGGRARFKRGRPPGGAGFPEAPPLAQRMSACGPEGGPGPPPVACVGGRSLSQLALWGGGEGRGPGGNARAAGGRCLWGKPRGGRGPSAVCGGPWRSPRSRSDPGENSRRRQRSRAKLGGSMGRVPLPQRRGASAFVGTPARRYLGRPLPSPPLSHAPRLGSAPRSRWNQRVHELPGDLSVS